ncbi:uncharacterized protein F4807DRAFT_467549 [Annulohypoxylon truncatum]|uniref:uncharacterized protein n=1 Tax=Annulohypoxylon truncatum TaxID=327061 RepID=UPI002007F35E|nr:uncharacterized protein F4807DRAFT_467549 [Annulohypoxylon truncatum]KAI1209656.1 hypothetical protein F4807DRAFT_467549 [Annulohypoxylon truncatum]
MGRVVRRLASVIAKPLASLYPGVWACKGPRTPPLAAHDRRSTHSLSQPGLAFAGEIPGSSAFEQTHHRIVRGYWQSPFSQPAKAAPSATAYLPFARWKRESTIQASQDVAIRRKEGLFLGSSPAELDGVTLVSVE